MSKKSAAFPLIWLLIYIVVTPVPLSNYVLCIGSDGHVEFEVGAYGRCTDAHPFDSEQQEVMRAEAASETDHCGSCVDLAIFFPLDTQPHVIPAKDIPAHRAVSAVGHAASQPTVPRILVYTPPFYTPTLINPTLASLRTTILLI